MAKEEMEDALDPQETLEALEEVNEIAATEGVDCLFIGTGDLGLRINKYGHKLNIEESIEKIAKAAKDHNKTWGRPVINKEDIKLLYSLEYLVNIFVKCIVIAIFVICQRCNKNIQ